MTLFGFAVAGPSRGHASDGSPPTRRVWAQAGPGAGAVTLAGQGKEPTQPSCPTGWALGMLPGVSARPQPRKEPRLEQGAAGQGRSPTLFLLFIWSEPVCCVDRLFLSQGIWSG